MSLDKTSTKSSCKGGLWTRGIYKIGDENHPLITVITVVLNGEAGLKKTIESILSQTHPNVELIVIDGGSIDNSLELIQSFDSQIDYWISEPDLGIYDAMNKGVALARGKWVNFMNSGDCFYSPTVVQTVFSNQNIGSSLIIYGNWEVRYSSSKKRMVDSGNIRQLWKGSQFCHQAVFIDSVYHKSLPYSLKDKIVSDFEFFYKTWKRGGTFLKISTPVASIEAGGLSDIKRTAVIKSWWNIIDKDFKSTVYFSYRFTREFLIAKFKRLVS